jgi:hypothetical protein
MIKRGLRHGPKMECMTQSAATTFFTAFDSRQSGIRKPPDQVELLKRDNVVSREAEHEGRTLAALGMDPASIEAVVPTYLRDRSWR